MILGGKSVEKLLEIRQLPSADREQIEEFVGYDAKGKAVVLHRSSLHPGISPAKALEEETWEPQALAPADPLFGGSLRLFSDFSRWKQAWRPKGA